jgi:hypothetical protein
MDSIKQKIVENLLNNPLSAETFDFKKKTFA